MRSNMLVMLVLLGVFAQSMYADELIFKNGDRLTGKINHALEGKLVFKSDVAGKITVDMSNIQTFSTDEAIEVRWRDNE